MALLARVRAEWQQTAEALIRDTVFQNPADAWLEDEPNPLLPHPRRPDHDELHLHRRASHQRGKHRTSRRPRHA